MMGTLAVHLAVLAVLLIFGFSVPPPPETEEGILVNFGTDETGSGLIEPSPPAVQEETSPPLPSETAVKSDEEPLLTQNTEEAPAVKKVDPEVEKKLKEQKEADKQQRAELEKERIKKAKEEADSIRNQQRETDITNKTKNALASSKNAGTTTTNEGVTGGQGNQGVPTGQVDSQNRGDGNGSGDKGISYDLGGRGVKNLMQPKYVYQVDGKVAITITVDKSGKVIRAEFLLKGSNTLDESLLRIAKEAALGTTFDQNQNAPLFQKGSIIYTFKLN
jgi:colicin import membrane protein